MIPSYFATHMRHWSDYLATCIRHWGTLKQWHTQWCLPDLQHTWGTLKQSHTSSDTFLTCNPYQTLGHTKTVTCPVIPSYLATCLRLWGTLKQWRTQWYLPTLQPAWDTGVITVQPYLHQTLGHTETVTHTSDTYLPCSQHETMEWYPATCMRHWGTLKYKFLQLQYDVSAGQNGQHMVRI